MQKTFLAVAFTMAIATVAVLTVTAKEAAIPQTAPLSAVIVTEGVHSRGGLAQLQAISILDLPTVEKLAAFFPKYDQRPTSKSAAGWEAGYRVYFNFKNGETICVTVSKNNNSDTWTIGKGDFDTQGDFVPFVEELQKRITLTK